ncbi:branched-chain amino acid aminotransferase [Acetobacter pasteurianus]|uniref:branched-chain amino acid aminotransferase n=1 Tax=Acetobacter pasteurianus TaxID=438 RepID=UPI000FF94448|nr:branched-chain amino acid aminotransferase [Acetobacter pasteurianus]GCD56657.1 branched-chain amino acid aminotransferase [Acetobacter pasteurianus NBRC 3222]
MTTESDTAFKITRKTDITPAAEREAMLANPGFGRVFTDHMAVVTYTEGKGWHSAEILPRQPLMLDPAASVLHYAQEIFEGMKAYRTPDGSVQLFRPDANARRFRHSAERMAMAQVPEDLFLDAVTQLVKLDKDWVPQPEVGTLYIRPFMIATEAALGVKPASEFKFIVIACAAGEYFSKDAGPVSVWVEERTVRASRGGTGTAKCGGNYAASLTAQMEGKEHGCHQVLFLDAQERRWLEEMGGMNVMMVFEDSTLQTPPLDSGTILHGITRDSLLTLARDRGLKVKEERYAIDQLYGDADSGKLKEVFACGTAAVVTPIGTFKSTEGGCTIGNGQTGEVTSSLRKALCDIQFGRAADTHGWIKKID